MQPEARLILPPDFLDYAWEVESKGVFWDVCIEANGHTYKVTFYDPHRLAQDVNDQVAADGFFAEENVVVIPSVTEQHMRKAAAALATSGGLARLRPEGPSM